VNDSIYSRAMLLNARRCKWKAASKFTASSDVERPGPSPTTKLYVSQQSSLVQISDLFYDFYSNCTSKEDYTTLVVLIADEIGSRRLLSSLPNEIVPALDSWYSLIPFDGSDSSQAQVGASFIQGHGECRYN